MNAKQAKAVGYIALSLPVVMLNKIIIAALLGITGLLLDWIVSPMIHSNKRIMAHGVRIMSDAIESEEK